MNLPGFLHASEAEKAKTLLQIIGVGDELARFELEESRLYHQRTEIGRLADRKKKAAEDMPFYPNVPKEPVSASELIRQQQDIMARNAENELKRRNAVEMARRYEAASENFKLAQIALKSAEEAMNKAKADAETAGKSAQNLKDESTAELEKNLQEIDALNMKVRANADKEKVEVEADSLSQEYEDLTSKLNDVRNRKDQLLESADLPLPGLSVQDGHLIYKGEPWDGMSGAEQLKVAVAIIRKLNPECGFVLMDKLEQMDTDTMKEFGAWLEQEGLQVIATRVSTGDECSVIIEDGMVKGNMDAVKTRAPSFVKGEIPW